MFNKKADIGLGVIIVIIIIVIALGWLVNEGWKECRADSDCGQGQYCNSKFECKTIPIIEKLAPQQNANYNSAAWVIGISLIAAALIFKWDSILNTFRKKGKKDRKDKEEYIDLSHKKNAEDSGLYDDFLDEKY